jgi:hypothetical protein
MGGFGGWVVYWWFLGWFGGLGVSGGWGGVWVFGYWFGMGWRGVGRG